MATEWTSWPHAPLHRLTAQGTYFVTVGTYRKLPFFNTTTRLDVLQRGLLKTTLRYGWHLEAWAIFPNHYHFVAHSPNDTATSLSDMLRDFQHKTAKWINKIDASPQRQVWHNFRDTLLTYQRSYLARLHYTHANAVHHGIVRVANQYRWCSAAWFERTASAAQIKTIYSMPLDRIEILDDFQVNKISSKS